MIPKVVREGEIRLLNATLKVFVLDNGQRVVEAESMRTFVHLLETGQLTEDDAKKIAGFTHRGEMDT